MTDSKTALVIAETATSTWSYHLRRVEGGKTFLTGAAPSALCGQKLGWDTRIPLKAYGTKSHIPESWCSKCRDEARRLGVEVGPGV